MLYLCCRAWRLGSLKLWWSAFSSMSSTALSSCSFRCLNEVHRAPKASASLCLVPSKFLTASSSALSESASIRHDLRDPSSAPMWRWLLQRLLSRLTARVSSWLISGTIVASSCCSSSTLPRSQLPALSTVCLRPRNTPAATLWVCRKASSLSRHSNWSSTMCWASTQGRRQLSALLRRS